MNSLEHHGVKGQKWGVRRYQNKDGTLTSAGKLHYQTERTRRYVRNTSKDVQSIVDSMTKRERDLLGAPDDYRSDDEIEDVLKRFVKHVGDTPVAFLNIYQDLDEDTGTIAIGTRSEA